MRAAEILKKLERKTGSFPRKAVEAAIASRETITPELLRILEDTVDRAEEIVAEDTKGKYFAHVYAMYLLAQFRETRAYPVMVRLAHLNEEILDELVGEIITEDLFRILASVCDGDTAPIEGLIEDNDVFEYVRSAALRSLLVMVRMGDKSRDGVMAYFQQLFEGRLAASSGIVRSSLVSCATYLYPEEVSGHIATAFEEGLVDPFYISPRRVEAVLAEDKESVLRDFHERYEGYIGDVTEEMSGWACFRQTAFSRRDTARKSMRESPLAASAMPQPHRSEKVLPNAACPCGSGKKYKKCCGRIV